MRARGRRETNPTQNLEEPKRKRNDLSPIAKSAPSRNQIALGFNKPKEVTISGKLLGEGELKTCIWYEGIMVKSQSRVEDIPENTIVHSENIQLLDSELKD